MSYRETDILMTGHGSPFSVTALALCRSSTTSHFPLAPVAPVVLHPMSRETQESRKLSHLRRVP